MPTIYLKQSCERPSVTVFGAAGRVGSATVRELLAQGATVRAVIHSTPLADELAASCELVTADLGDPRSIEAAASGADAVQVICPMRPTAADPLREGSAVLRALIDGLRAAAPATVVAISDYGAEQTSGTGVTMIFNELEARLAGLPCEVTFLRSAEHMHNWQRMIPGALSGGVLWSLHHPLSKLFPTIAAADVGLISAAMLLSPAGESGTTTVVYAEGPRRYSATDVAAAITTATGRQVVARELPFVAWASALQSGGLGDGYARLVAELFEAHNAGRIEVESGATLRHGNTELTQGLGLEGVGAPARV